MAHERPAIGERSEQPLGIRPDRAGDAVIRRWAMDATARRNTLFSDIVAKFHAELVPPYAMVAVGPNGGIHAVQVRFFVRNDAERRLLKNSHPSFLVVDEAHCVDQWGQDFPPEYGQLAEVRDKLGAPPVLAFTATAGKEMQHRILDSLGIPDATVFVRDVDRPNIVLLRAVQPRSSI